MYSIRLGYSAATDRIKALTKHNFEAEALVTAMFTTEKTLRRTLRQLVVSAGFTSNMADKVIGNLRGLDAIKSNWELYDPQNRKLSQLLRPSDWQTIKRCAEMRNELIHGKRVYDREKCRQEVGELMKTLTRLKSFFDSEYGYSGWETASRRTKSTLHSDPKIRLRTANAQS